MRMRGPRESKDDARGDDPRRRTLLPSRDLVPRWTRLGKKIAPHPSRMPVESSVDRTGFAALADAECQSRMVELRGRQRVVYGDATRALYRLDDCLGHSPADCAAALAAGVESRRD